MHNALSVEVKGTGMPEKINFFDWPEVPAALRPKKLFHAGGVDSQTNEALQSLGWDPVDVRLLETDTTAKRANAILAWLEGVRLGSIEPSNTVAKFVELEMRACGLHTGNVEPENQRSTSGEDLNALLSFGK